MELELFFFGGPPEAKHQETAALGLDFIPDAVGLKLNLLSGNWGVLALLGNLNSDCFIVSLYLFTSGDSQRKII